MVNIKFGTDGWRAIIAKEYTTDNVARVATGTAKWLHQLSGNPTCVVGHDCRFGGEMFADVTARVLAGMGVKVYLAKGFVSTPMVSLGANKLDTTAGVVLTASHNPPAYNGFKLKSGHGGPSLPDDIARVESLIPDEGKIPSENIQYFVEKGLVEYVDLEDMYIQQVKGNFDLEVIKKANINLAFDAMYGSGQNVLRKILPETICLHCEHNPGFHGQAPEPLDKNLDKLREMIKNNPDIDAGLAIDGDADRIGMYDSDGNFVDAHHIILLLIHYLHKYKKMDGKVVIAFSVSKKVHKLCQHYNLPFEVTKIGFKYICGHMVEEDVLVGGEESGGIAVKGHIPERDGIWDGLILLEFMARTGKGLQQLIEEVYDIVGPFSYNRYDLHIREEQKQAIIQNCIDGKYSSFGKYEVIGVESTDGFKYDLGQDRTVMIRPSGTEPVLRVYGEAENKETVKDVLESAKATLLGQGR